MRDAQSLRASHRFLNVLQQRLTNATSQRQQKIPERHVKQTRMDHSVPVDPDTAGHKTKLSNLKGDAQKQHSESHRSTFASRCQCKAWCAVSESGHTDVLSVKLNTFLLQTQGPWGSVRCAQVPFTCATGEQDRGHTSNSWRHFRAVNAWKKRSHVRRYFWRSFFFIIQQSPHSVLGLDRDAYICWRHVEEANTQRVGKRVR